ncbi:glycosyltransferase [Budvicia diplopodorum]|uniref:glycosyltransferase n=1 Tax=Budvicia diplopodorum TaxID=1119056 RepID=UPI00135BD027|nr:glycosyltransferase [Budvicia diplopodorum]
MLLITNTLAFNGGTTFLLRFAKGYLQKEGKKVGVLVLFNNIDKHLEVEIKKYADVYFLSEYIFSGFRFMCKNQLSVFLPFQKKLLSRILPEDKHLHVMGIFGLIFSRRLTRLFGEFKVTVGIYHQNEYMYRTKKPCKFSEGVFKLVKDVPDDNFVFFNEFNIESYGKFYMKDYANPSLLPIGIDIKADNSESKKPVNARIVSIGNLVNFKTYNLHVINSLNRLPKKSGKEVVYDIYGEGDNNISLQQLVNDLGLTERVRFWGNIKYSEMKDVLQDASVFVGSGTALLEAAALGVPALTGIESVKDPITYGYLYEIEGFSYNELMPGRKVYNLVDKLNESINSTDEYWTDLSSLCKKKSKDFSISCTVDGFIRLNDKAKLVSFDRNNSICFFMSFLKCVIYDKLNLDKSFRNRRDQSSFSNDMKKNLL